MHCSFLYLLFNGICSLLDLYSQCLQRVDCAVSYLESWASTCSPALGCQALAWKRISRVDIAPGSIDVHVNSRPIAARVSLTIKEYCPASMHLSYQSITSFLRLLLSPHDLNFHEGVAHNNWGIRLILLIECRKGKTRLAPLALWIPLLRLIQQALGGQMYHQGERGSALSPSLREMECCRYSVQIAARYKWFCQRFRRNDQWNGIY